MNAKQGITRDASRQPRMRAELEHLYRLYTRAGVFGEYTKLRERLVADYGYVVFFRLQHACNVAVRRRVRYDGHLYQSGLPVYRGRADVKVGAS